MQSKPSGRLPFLLFFGSGLCALVYETVWLRQLVFSFGITIHAISAVLAAWMFGLSFGAGWIGRRARRIANPLRWYAWFEGAIALYAVVLHFVLADALPSLVHALHAWLPGSPTALHLVRFLLAFTLLAIPTTLMGGTLPLLGQLVARGAAGAGARIGQLYGLNTLGAVAGAALAGFWMLQHLGILATTVVAALVNFAIAAVALRASRSGETATLPAPAVPPAPRSASDGAAARPPAVRRLVTLVAFCTGFAALSYEVLWNRTLLPYVHNSSYAFSMILIVYLLGVAAGSLAYPRVAAGWTSVRVLGIVQLLLAASVWVSIHVTGALPDLLGRLTAWVGTDSWGAALLDIAVGTALVVFVPAFLMGLGFPLAAALYAVEEAEVGLQLGGLYALNTVGNILGSLVTGFVLIGAIGVRNSFAVSIGCNALAGFACITWRQPARRRALLAVGLSAATIAAFVACVPSDVFRRYYERMTATTILFYKEEATDTVMVVEHPDGGRMIRYADGRGTAGTRTNTTNRLYGHVPMLLHPQPDSVLSICFGVGNTLSALAQWRPRRLVAVELSPAVLETARFFDTNRDVLATPGLEVVINDGRNFLLTSDERFDVVQLEPPEIHTAGVVNLYTREFYELARADLKPGGIVAQWLNVVLMPEHEMKMLVRTMQEVFPATSLWAGAAWWDVMVIGSVEPLRVDARRMVERVAAPAVREDLARIGFHGAEELLAHHLLGPESLRAWAGDVAVVTDDRTWVDFSVPQSAAAGFGLFLYQTQLNVPKEHGARRVRARLELLAHRESPSPLLDLATLPDDERARFSSALAAEVERQREAARAELAQKP